MKTVFTNSMCAHVWAQLSQPHGHSDSMSFDGAVAYSYREAEAHIMRKPDGSTICLFNSNHQRSNSTIKHMHEYRRAYGYAGPSFNVPDILTQRFHTGDIAPEAHARNIKHFERVYREAIADMLKYIAESWRISGDKPRGYLIELANNWHQYAEAFGIPSHTLDVNADVAPIYARRDRILNDPKRAERLEKAAAQRAAQLVAASERSMQARAEHNRIASLKGVERVALWLAGGAMRLNFGDVASERGALLRIRDGKVETSMGAECPLDYVVPAMKFWRSTVNASMPYPQSFAAPNLYPVKLGHFQLDSIDADGNVRAGCHYIKRAELERLETLLAAVS